MAKSAATEAREKSKSAAKPARKAVKTPTPKPTATAESKEAPKTAANVPAPVGMAVNPVNPVKPAKASKNKGDAATDDKPKKPKLVRDSFTMPEQEYAALGEVKKACLKAGFEVKKSQLLRVGVLLVRQLETGKLKEILAGLPALKAGRPKKSR